MCVHECMCAHVVVTFRTHFIACVHCHAEGSVFEQPQKEP